MNALIKDCSEQSPEQSQHLTPPDSKSFAFAKSLRLLSSSDFSPVFSDAPIRASHPQFLILARPNKLGVPRLGLVIAKKHVRKAHDRNCIKRQCREGFRLRQHKIPAIDAIVLARRGADNNSPAETAAILNGLWKRIIKKATSLSSKE